MKPYYEDDAVTIYHGDCREILPLLGLDPALVLTDPPYGVSERTDRHSKGRDNPLGGRNNGQPVVTARDFPPVHGDDEPFDPSHLLGFRRLVLFGANYYAERLPASPTWIVWDKLDGLTTEKRAIGLDDNADVELAWSNVGGPARLIPHRWKGLIKASERTDQRVHPTQKPVALMARIIDWLTEPGDLVLDPYAGSGSTLRAAKDHGRRAIGIEHSGTYCSIAARRCAQDVLAVDEAA
jgi:site-specific DNA-methyltransferase (adenine-specific)